jgi:hypothetical protein
LTNLQPRILFLFSDTGGGHRGCRSDLEALELEFSGHIMVEMVVFLSTLPRPFNRMPDLYPKMVKSLGMGLGFHLSDGNRRKRLITASAWPYVRRSIQTWCPSILVT